VCVWVRKNAFYVSENEQNNDEEGGEKTQNEKAGKKSRTRPIREREKPSKDDQQMNDQKRGGSRQKN